MDEFEIGEGDAKPVRDRVRDGKLTVVYSTHGKFRDELRGKRALRLLAELSRDKKARLVAASELEEKMRVLPSELRSDRKGGDDRHILALALASGARLLYTEDGPLARDFTDSAVIRSPKGKVYLLAQEARAPPAQKCVQNSGIKRRNPLTSSPGFSYNSSHALRA